MAIANIKVLERALVAYPFKWIGAEPYCVTQDVVINEFDYLVARFLWNYPSAGSDLDIQVRYEDNGVPSVDGIYVGYGAANDTVLAGEAIKSNAYLWWGLDDTNSSNAAVGIEGVLINLKKFKTDFPGSGNIIKVGIYAVWFGSVATGNFQLEVKTYKGGEMSKLGTDIINTGGTAVSSDIRNLNTLITNKLHSPPTSFKVGVLEYNKTTDKAILILS